jgi:nucleotide-binding universal stress UspA family protein
MFDKILVPYDGSMASEEAFALALELAGKYQSALIVLSVARPPEPATSPGPTPDAVRAHYKERFGVMTRRAEAKAVKVRFDVAVGQPAEEIVDLVEKDDIDLIVMGRRGKNMLQRWHLGTVSDRVLAYAHCAVLVVH